MIGFFEEADGVKSLGRLHSFLALAGGLILSGYSVYVNTVEGNLALIVTLFGYAFAQKVGQKWLGEK